MSNFLPELIARGYLQQCTNLEALTELLNSRKITVYVGFDCTAKSLHIGNLLQVMVARLIQQHGHRVIILIGDATTTIGDPTGRDEMRKILTATELEQNLQGIKHSLSKFLDFGDKPDQASMVSNSTWLKPISYLDFLLKYGKLISVNRMLTMESVKSRLAREQALSFLEFNYMLLQAYDFNHLYQEHDCVLQIGGSDQWGNIVSGIELIRKLHHKEVFGLTTPLITTSSGVKMGKSASGAMWMNEDLLSPYDYYQYWRNIDDNDLLRFANLYGEFTKEGLAELTNLEINAAKKMLAQRLTMMCHGEDAAKQAAETARRIFEEKQLDDHLKTIVVTAADLARSITISEILLAAGLAESRAAAKRLIKGGGCRINDDKIDDDNALNIEHYQGAKTLKISAGRKQHALIKIG